MCAREGGANTTSFLAAHFAKGNRKLGGGGKEVEWEREGGEEICAWPRFRIRIFFRRRRISYFALRNAPQKNLTDDL